MIPTARLTPTGDGVVAEGEGWYVLNARAARWRGRDTFGRACTLEAEPIPEVFTELGFQLAVLQPGEPNGYYHRESIPEDFLVVAGRCLLVIEGEERPLECWDFVHCPAGTDHIFVGAGDGPCVIVMVSPRRPDATITYPVSELAARHGASAAVETDEPVVAYARFERWVGPYREGDLPLT